MTFPSDWRKTIVIPVPDSTNYHAIALTSKTMEQMINQRHVWYLESLKLLSNVQCGFRSRCSTVFVFLDFEKAYDTTWNNDMRDLCGFGAEA